MTKINVLHIMNSSYGRFDQYGGRSKKIVDELCDSKNQKYNINIISDSRSVTADKSKVNVNITICNKNIFVILVSYGLSLLRMKKLKRRFLWKIFDSKTSRIIKKMDLEDLAVVHTWEWIPKSIKTIKRKYPNVKIIRDIVVNRYFEYFSGDPIVKEIKHTDIFLSPSSFTTKCFKEWNIPFEKQKQIPFGTDTIMFKPSIDKPNSPIRFAFSGGISKRKGSDSLLRVWNGLNLENAELHLYGKIRDIDKKLLKNPSIFTYGYIPLEQELPKNHVFVFPSLLEGSAKSVYEAMACGLAIIASHNAGSIIEDGIEGFLVDAMDDDMLKNAILKLYNHPELLEIMGRKAREKATHYTWDHYSNNIIQLYEDVLPS